ncbi:FecR family protein [Pedobacter sp. GR22-6]|uniref:FecR family protein n=1 Tax=Pedobacter sp. GR22-6 TaxID=3127957 RepID=UPI00307E68D6
MKGKSDLLERYINGNCTPEEKLYVDLWLDTQYVENNEWDKMTDEHKKAFMIALFGDINKEIGLKEKSAVELWPRIRLAAGIAAAVATIVFGVWFFSPSRHSDNDRHPELVSGSDIAPGRSGATITLANGEVIQLSEAKKGVIIDPTSLTYDDGSEIASEAAQPRNDERGGGRHPELVSGSQLTASTAKGQTYEFTLPDGSHVFLNADSRIIFPSQFSGKERKILLEGEAYFVVKHNQKQPFRVESKGQIVEDIGTEFNINAYADESSVKTTLVEGSARVISSAGRADAMSVTLMPNQQASLLNGKLKVKMVDPESATAWKSGILLFNSMPLEELMRQVARWYDVEVVYENESLKQHPMEGSVSKYSNVSRIMKTIENTGAVKFKITGRKIVVSK